MCHKLYERQSEVRDLEYFFLTYNELYQIPILCYRQYISLFIYGLKPSLYMVYFTRCNVINSI